jgi:hypothetical protein
MATTPRTEYMRHYMRAYRARQAEQRRTAATQPPPVTVGQLRHLVATLVDNVVGLSPRGRQELVMLLSQLDRGHLNA